MTLPVKKPLKLILACAAAAAAIITAAPNISPQELGGLDAQENVGPDDTYPEGDIIPYQKIAEDKVEKVAKIVKKRTLYRYIKPSRFKSNKAAYEYLLDRLSLAAEVTRLMGAGDYIITYKGGGAFHGEDSRGLKGDFELLYADGQKRVYYGEGECRCALIGTVRGRALMVLQYKEVSENGLRVMENKLNAYLKVDNKFFAAMLKTFAPILGALADRKLSKFISSAKIVGESIALEPEKVYKYIEKSKSIDEAQKKEFFELFIKK